MAVENQLNGSREQRGWPEEGVLWPWEVAVSYAKGDCFSDVTMAPQRTSISEARGVVRTMNPRIARR
jgi:hypothetical protein